MYLFTRSRHFPLGITSQARTWLDTLHTQMKDAGVPNSLYQRILSPEIGSVAQVAPIASLADLSVMNDKLMQDGQQQDQSFGELHTNEGLARVIHGELPDMLDANTSRFVVVTQAIVQPGYYQRGLGVGSDIATHLTEASKAPVTFLFNETGPFGGCTWLQTFSEIGALQQSLEETAGKEAWWQFLDNETLEMFIAQPYTNRRLIFQRL